MREQPPQAPQAAPEPGAPAAPKPEPQTVDLVQWRTDALRSHALASRHWTRLHPTKYGETARRTVLTTTQRLVQVLELAMRMAEELGIAAQKLADSEGCMIRAESLGRVFSPGAPMLPAAADDGAQTEVHDAPIEMLPDVGDSSSYDPNADERNIMCVCGCSKYEHVEANRCSDNAPALVCSVMGCGCVEFREEAMVLAEAQANKEQAPVA